MAWIARRTSRTRGGGQDGFLSVDQDYVRRGRNTSTRGPDVGAFNQGHADAVSTVLRGYGTVWSMVWGAYGEASDDVHQLCDAVVDAEAERSWRQLGARSAAEARSYLMSRTRRSWGLVAVREMARYRCVVESKNIV